MRTRYSLRAVALAGVCLAPLAAAAQEFDTGSSPSDQQAAPQYKNEVDIGARYQSGNSPLYGRYTGTDSKGFSSLGGFHLEGGDAPNSGKTLHYEVTGTDLDFGPSHLGPNNALAPESEVKASIGQQGTWKINAGYDAITYTGQNFYSPYLASGAYAPKLTGTQSGGDLTSLSNLAQETAGTRRDIGTVDGKSIIGNWTISGGFRHEHKEGTLLETMMEGPGETSGTAFPEPVNYDTDRYTVQGQYATRRFQALLGYDYSRFTDNNISFVAPALQNIAGGAYASNVYSLPGNNDAHYVTGMVGYNLTPTTRFNGNFRYGLEMAEDSLSIPSSGATMSAAAAAANSGVGSLMARTYDGTASVTSRPLSKLDVRVFYGIDGRDSGDGTRTLYGQGNPGSPANLSSQYNIVEQSWTKQRAGVEAGYHVLPDTKLTLGYAYDDVNRDAGDANLGKTSGLGYWFGHTGENTMSAKLANSSIANLHASVSYEHSVRTGDMETLTPITAYATSGAFYQAPMTADRVKVRADYVPGDQWDVGLNGKYETHAYHYPAGVTGTARDYNASIGPDFSYSPTDKIATHLFYTYEEIYYDNMGNSTYGTYPANYNGSYSAATTNSLHTVGLGGDWKVTDRLKLGVDYTFSYGDVGYNMFDGLITAPSVNTAHSGPPVIATDANYLQSNVSLPNINSSMHSVKLKAEYQLASNITLVGGYDFDMYKDNDWADGWDPVVLSSGTQLTSGESQNSYRIHTVYTAMRVKF